jgi:hypothetical protein
MDKKGVEALYKVVDSIKDEFDNNPFVNQTTMGTLTEVDLLKNTIFPLAHITINNVQLNENNLVFNITIFNLDIVTIIKEDEGNLFFGNDNLMYILTNQLYVINRLVSRLRQRTLYNDGWEISGTPQSDVINKEMENMLAGYQTTINIVVPNDINMCYAEV